ncbi:MAG: succinylglutamate desuccinylase/aspartoacylase family protein [Nitriliruptorales bacterium]|nr:succinylglutamate desuccinylase/aspartoacylase family protein [Nitriliruptorales bacterium]
MSDPVVVAGATIPPGTRRDLTPVASEAYTGDRTTIPMAVLHGRVPGPRVFVTAAVHGDELNGIGVCRTLLGRVQPDDLAGTVIVVPIVNVLGAQLHSRYLPDRRDLNRSFPGSHSGSMAARIARLVMDEVVTGSTVGIDLHTAANRRTNVPQLRIDTADDRALELALAFGAPYVLDATRRAGSLRHVAGERGVTVLTFEGGEALRFDETCIEVATDGILRVLHRLDMLPSAPPAPAPPVVMHESRWLRAERGGILDLHVQPGDTVAEGQEVWTTTSPLGAERSTITASLEGVVIGATTVPLVTPGDAILHIGVPGERAPSEDDPTEEEDLEEDPEEDTERS